MKSCRRYMDFQSRIKEVFLLHVMAEMSYRDIGELFRKGESWSRVTYYRAKKKILEKLGGAENEV